MILNELVLHNVGTFGGRHVIDLTPSSPAKPIVLVGGLNGAGKTTILESIQLALYGSLSHQSGRRNGSYEKYLRGLIHRGAPASEGAAIELSFTAHQEGAGHRYTIRRSWKSTGASIREILLVSVDGRHNQPLTSTWTEHIETFLPRGIAGLFFFDGEQIEALADLDRSRQVLGSALAALLGLDLVERLAADLTVLKRRQRGEHVPDDLRRAVEEKSHLFNVHRDAENSAVKAEKAADAEKVHRQAAFYEATDAYRAAGGELAEQRETTEAEASNVRTELAQCEDGIRHELAGVAPLLQLGGLLRQLIERVRLESGAGRSRLLVDALIERDDTVLRKLAVAEVRSSTVRAIEQFLEDDRKDRLAASGVQEIIGFPDDVELEGLLSAALPEARKRLEALTERRVELMGETDRAMRVLAAIPDAEALAPLHQAREEARRAWERANVAHQVAVKVREAAKAERVKAAAAHEAALDRAAHADLAADDDRRLVQHVERVRATLESLRITSTRQHLERISQLVLEALGMLLRKEKLVTDVQIDPATHTVALTGVDGHTLLAEDLSAGERQLLAVALLWGLARAAGQPLPVVIDTPLGRLDSSHRKHLLERYFPQASHQVILLSTDTEINHEAFKRIAPWIGRSYRLEFDPDTSATRVEDGYFWEWE